MIPLRNSQSTRKTEFANLLKSVANDTPLLLFPLRIETHFRKPKLKYEESDMQRILKRFHDLLDAFIKNQSDKNFRFFPLLAKVREAVEVSDFIPTESLINLSSFTKKIFQYIFLENENKKYSSYKDAIITALSNLTKEERIKSSIINASELYIVLTSKNEQSTSYPLNVDPCSYSSYIKPAETSYVKPVETDSSSSGSNVINLGSGFPGSPSLYDTKEIYALHLQALLESWIEVVNQETVHTAAGAKELCVRIFPDQIFLDYLTDSLTEKEFMDGKRFWLQWYIASGSRKREYEAWQVLCDKYPTYRAAWIVRQMKPKDINRYKIKGDRFYRRPYQGMITIEDACDDIYRKLADIHLDDTESSVNKEEEEYKIETAIRKNLGIIKEHLFQIDRDIISCEYVVDYLFDKIKSTIQYLRRRLNTFKAFYRKNAGKYVGNLRQMELWDIDYTMLLSLINEVDDFMDRLGERSIPLDELIQKYLDDPLHDIFPKVKINRSGKPDMPVSNILPDRFMFIGEALPDTKNFPKLKDPVNIVQYGRKVKQNIQMGISLNEDIDEEPYNINTKGDLEVNGGLAWMVDYDKAEEAGMAITVPLDAYVSGEFNYIYVLGVKNTTGKEKEFLHSLFNSHNYTSSGLGMIKPGTPTNIVEGGKPLINLDPEEEMRRRYEIEVEEVYEENNAEYDSKILSNVLNLNYNECWGHTVNYDNRELSNAEIAYRELWSFFRKDIASADTRVEKLLDFIEGFVIEHVKARGTLPSFRIGNQPYGILPITHFLEMSNNIGLTEPALLKDLNNLLISLADEWKRLRIGEKDKDNGVVYSETLKDNDADRKYLEMTGLTPYSTTFYERDLISSPLLPSREANVPSCLDPLDSESFFDPLFVEDSEKEVPFDTKNANLLTDLIKTVKDIFREKAIDITDDECNLLVSEFLDLFTHRLDAWFSGILDYLMLTKGHKTPMIGAYGWVFNLKENKREEITHTKKGVDIVKMMKLSKKDESDELKIFTNSGDDKGEYIVAPSLQHALSAAILRSAYLKTKRDGGDSHMCTNLSSTRVRQALRMITGIKQGMSTGIILGADLERYLHEAYRMGKENEYEMDKYIYPLRKLFPQTISLSAENEDERANDYVMQVINGEMLLNTFLDEWANYGTVSDWLENKNKSKTPLWWYKELKEGANMSVNHFKCLYKLIERLVDSYDALHDLLLAEGVHRLVQGDFNNYAAISNFMVEGKGHLPEPAILETPMEYVVVAHKVAIALPECKNPPEKPMCIAEPSVNKWLEETIGNLDNILFYVGRTNEEGTVYSSCSLGELDITPIEYLYLSTNDHLFFSYLEARWRLKNNFLTDKLTIYESEPKSNNEGDIFEINVDEEETECFSLYENELRMKSLREIIMQCSVMKANDWIASANSDAQDEMATDMEDLKMRYTLLRAQLAQLNMEMISCLRSLENLEEDEACDDKKIMWMYELLCRCVETGLINSLPARFNPEIFIYYTNPNTFEKEYRINPIIEKLQFDKAVALQQSFIKDFAYMQKQLDERISESEEIVRERGDEIYTIEQYNTAFKKLLLNNFGIFPRFTLHYALSAEQRKAYAKAIKEGIDGYTNLNRTIFEEWQSDVAEVREYVKKWHHLSMFQNACGGNTGNVSILQTNSDGNPVLDKWLGCKVENESELEDVDSLVIYNSNALPKQKPIDDAITYRAGLIIDAWTEFIPYRKQTAGMVFHCDQPDNEAPQALLLALHPKFNLPNKKWKIKNIMKLLDSTRFMLMNRAVEPDMIYQDAYLSKLFPLLKTTTPRPLVTSSGNIHIPRGQSYLSDYILDAFPGSNLLR